MKLCAVAFFILPLYLTSPHLTPPRHLPQESRAQWPEDGAEWSDPEDGTSMDCGLLQAMAEEDEEINVYNEETFGVGVYMYTLKIDISLLVVIFFARFLCFRFSSTFYLFTFQISIHKKARMTFAVVSSHSQSLLQHLRRTPNLRCPAKARTPRQDREHATNLRPPQSSRGEAGVTDEDWAGGKCSRTRQ